MKKLEELREDDGFIDISEFKINKLNNSRHVYTLNTNNKTYYFKYIDYISDVYNELIAEEIAKDYNIPHIHYDLASYNGNIGVISESFLKEDEVYTSISNILKKVYLNDDKNHNNLTDLWDTFDILFNNEELTSKLINKIINIFIFDILIANNDRHDENYGIITSNNNIDVSPIHDNSCMLSEISLYDNEYGIMVEQDDNDTIEDFLNISSPEFTELLKSKLWIIEEDNINKILDRVEKRINRKIEDNIKDKIKNKFSLQLNKLNSYIKNNYKK